MNHKRFRRLEKNYGFGGAIYKLTQTFPDAEKLV
jgi:hypothetical protein